MHSSPDSPPEEPHRPQTKEEDRLSDLERNRAFRKEVAKTFFQGQFWFILKNVIGWTLMLIAWPVGVALPGPGGVPLFIIGFALASIPGKRKITSHMMRGRPVHVRAGPYLAISTVLSVIAVLGLLWFIRAKKEWILDTLQLRGSSVGEIAVLIVVTSLVAVVVCYVVVRLGFLAVNFFLRGMPAARRWMRPKLRKHGIHFLPRRRKVVDGSLSNVNENEIIELTPESQERFTRIGKWLLRWGIRVVILGAVIWALSNFVFPFTGNPARDAVVEPSVQPTP